MDVDAATYDIGAKSGCNATICSWSQVVAALLRRSLSSWHSLLAEMEAPFIAVVVLPCSLAQTVMLTACSPQHLR
jgi:hypothetical protein